MRIVYVLTTLGIGGAEKQVIDLADRMVARGHSVSMLVLAHAGEEWPTTLPTLRLNLRKTPGGVWKGLMFARRFVALLRPEIIHSHTFPANMFARMLRALFVFRPDPPRLINTIHNVYEGGRQRMMLYRLTDVWVSGITAVSAAVAERFLKIGAVSRRKMRVLTNGINTETYSQNQAMRRRTREQMQAGGKFVWLAVGRIAPAKDYPNLLRAFRRVRDEQMKAVLWIAGEYDGEQDLFPLDGVEGLAGLASPADPERPDGSIGPDASQPGVELLGLRRDIRELLNAADGFVLSSAWEGMPIAIGEAMSVGKPIVATNVGGVHELLGKTGIAVPAKDSAALAKAMLRVMSMSEEQRAAMGEVARERVEEFYSMTSKAHEWERLYFGWVERRLP